MENTSCMCQHCMTCAGILPCASAIFLITGSLNRVPSLVALPKVKSLCKTLHNSFYVKVCVMKSLHYIF